MRKMLSLGAAICVASVGQATTLWTSGFETQDFSEWTGLATTESEVPTIDGSQFHTGSFSASVPGTNVDGGSGLNGYFKNIGAVDAGLTTTMTFWMKLGGTSGNNRHYSEIRSYAGDAFGVGALDQLVAIGAYNGATNVIDSAGGITTGSSTVKWQARVAFAGYTNGGWFQLNQAANRTLEWTRFDVVVSPTDIGFYVNGVLGTALNLSRGGATWTADSVVMGSRLTSAGLSANFDDFSVDAVPEPGTMLALAGLGAFVARRRKKTA